MKLFINRQFNGELDFQKQNFKLSVFRYKENEDAYTVANDVTATSDDVEEFVKYATMSQEKVDQLTDVPLDRVYALRFRAKVLCAIAQFNATFIAHRQLCEFLSMKDNKLVSDSSLSKALDSLVKLGFVETVKLRVKDAKSDTLTLYKISGLRMKDGSMQKVLASKLSTDEIKEISINSGLRLKAGNILQNNIISSLIVEMFKAGVITEAFLPGTFDAGSLSAAISAYVTLKSEADVDKRLYIFAPRRIPESDEYVKSSILAFSKAHAKDDFLPKLLLCCEDADAIFDTNDLLSDLKEDVQFIFTDDLSFANDFSTAFSLFDENGTELQLAFGQAEQKPQAKKQGGKKPSNRRQTPQNNNRNK